MSIDMLIHKIYSDIYDPHRPFVKMFKTRPYFFSSNLILLLVHIILIFYIDSWWYTILGSILLIIYAYASLSKIFNTTYDNDNFENVEFNKNAIHSFIVDVKDKIGIDITNPKQNQDLYEIIVVARELKMNKSTQMKSFLSGLLFAILPIVITYMLGKEYELNDVLKISFVCVAYLIWTQIVLSFLKEYNNINKFSRICILLKQVNLVIHADNYIEINRNLINMGYKADSKSERFSAFIRKNLKSVMKYPIRKKEVQK